MNKTNILIDLGCLMFMSSVIMDSYLWVATGYLIPCWTMVVMSGGIIILLQTIKKLIKEANVNA